MQRQLPLIQISNEQTSFYGRSTTPLLPTIRMYKDKTVDTVEVRQS